MGELGVDANDLEDAEAAAVAKSPIIETALGVIEDIAERQSVPRGELVINLVGLLALGAEPADQPLNLQDAKGA